MPLYEYECKPNHHRFEVRHGINESPVHTCPECGGEVRRVINPVGIVFKGSGFYATDSRKSASPATGSVSSGTKESKESSDSSSKTDAATGGESKGSTDKAAS